MTGCTGTYSSANPKYCMSKISLYVTRDGAQFRIVHIYDVYGKCSEWGSNWQGLIK
jgi:hypothetical protein